MEESVWLYIGVIAILLSVAIITSVFLSYEESNNEQLFFDGLQQLARQADILCKAPLQTQLSAPITIPAGGLLYAETDRLCAQYEGKIRCKPSSCVVNTATIVNLTSNETQTLFRSHQYTCTILRDDTLVINCQG